MPREALKTRENDGVEFEVVWGEDFCYVGTVVYVSIDRASAPAGMRADPQFDAADLDRLIGTLQRARREAYGEAPAGASRT